MFDWIGSLQIRDHTARRVVLSLSPATHILGWVALLVGGGIAWMLAPVDLWLAAVPVGFGLFGLALACWRREFDFDGEAGVLRYRHQLLGLGTTQVIPLFHIRAVVVALRGSNKRSQLRKFAVGDYVAYVERRIGEPLYLDESRRCAHLLAMAEAVSEVTELRLEYDAMSQV